MTRYAYPKLIPPDVGETISVISEKEIPFNSQNGMAEPKIMLNSEASPTEMPQRVIVKADSAMQEVAYWDEGDPTCLVNLLPNMIKEKAMQLPPELLLSAQKNRDRIKSRTKAGMADSLRVALWQEYYACVDNRKPEMRTKAILHGVCDSAQFKELIRDPALLAYILTPPGNYHYAMQSILDVSLMRLREIVALPLVNTEGEINTKLIDQMLKIVMMVDNRVKGSVVQRVAIDQTTKSLQVSLNQDYQPPKSIKDIDSELKSINEEIGKIRSGRIKE